MQIYKISQTVNQEYDTFDSAVVVAGSYDEAKNMHPGGKVNEASSWYRDSWCDPVYVRVEYIGEAADGIKNGVICSSFNAG